MNYRDDRDALRGRVEDLEHALEAATKQLEALGKDKGERVAELEQQIAQTESVLRQVKHGVSELKKSSSSPRRWSLWQAAALVLPTSALAVAGTVAFVNRSGPSPVPAAPTIEPTPSVALAPVTVTTAMPRPQHAIAADSARIPCHVTLSLAKLGTDLGAFNEPSRIAVDSEGGVFVSDKTGRVQRFDREGNLVGTILPTTVNTPHGPLSTDIGQVGGLAVDSKGHVFVSIGYDVVEYDAAKGDVITKIPHSYPNTCFRDIAIDRAGMLLVRSACTDSNRYQLVKMTPNGKVLAKFEEGPAWQFDTAAKMAVDGNGTIFAPHSHENQVYALDPHGKPTMRINVGGGGPARHRWTRAGVCEELSGRRRNRRARARPRSPGGSVAQPVDRRPCCWPRRAALAGWPTRSISHDP